MCSYVVEKIFPGMSVQCHLIEIEIIFHTVKKAEHFGIVFMLCCSGEFSKHDVLLMHASAKAK